ncbi:MAG: hypothetical protein V4692_15915 [Bdellovibrionota bacterium]
MEKISGIIPKSARVTSVDMKEANPVRPGTPSFGRPQGVSSLAKPALVSTAPETARIGAGIHDERMTWRSEDAMKAGIASSVSNSFFMKNDKPAEVSVKDIDAVRLIPVDQMPARSNPAGFKSELFKAAAMPAPVSSFDEGFGGYGSAEPELQQPDGLYPKGSFIDRTA